MKNIIINTGLCIMGAIVLCMALVIVAVAILPLLAAEKITGRQLV